MMAAGSRVASPPYVWGAGWKKRGLTFGS